MKRMRTPWGTADSVRQVAPGIQAVSTPGHGGFKLDRARNARVHPAFREPGGWYEGDLKWAVVAVTFTEDAGFTTQTVTEAHATLKNRCPDAYEAVYGVKVTAEESGVVRERKALAACKGRMLITACWGEWATNVPPGHVGVFARVDGREGAPGSEEGYYLVTREQYETGRLVIAGRRTMIHPLPADARPVEGARPFK